MFGKLMPTKTPLLWSTVDGGGWGTAVSPDVRSGVTYSLKSFTTGGLYGVDATNGRFCGALGTTFYVQPNARDNTSQDAWIQVPAGAATISNVGGCIKLNTEGSKIAATNPTKDVAYIVHVSTGEVSTRPILGHGQFQQVFWSQAGRALALVAGNVIIDITDPVYTTVNSSYDTDANYGVLSNSTSINVGDNSVVNVETRSFVQGHPAQYVSTSSYSSATNLWTYADVYTAQAGIDQFTLTAQPIKCTGALSNKVGAAYVLDFSVYQSSAPAGYYQNSLYLGFLSTSGQPVGSPRKLPATKFSPNNKITGYLFIDGVWFLTVINPFNLAAVVYKTIRDLPNVDTVDGDWSVSTIPANARLIG